MEQSGSPRDRPRPRPSRRALLLGIGGVLVVGGGAAAGVALRPRQHGRLVKPMLQDPPFTVAHRGGSADWPEMSLYAYERSAASSVDALEFSLGRSRDGVWFGLHDATLDRVCGTTGFVAAEHDWSEIRQHLIRPPAAHAHQPSRPFLRFDDFVRRFSGTHSLWVDPKAVGSEHYPELLDLMSALVHEPTEVFVAKSYCSTVSWGSAARKLGYQSWGFYYGHELAADPALFARTQSAWSLLGLDIQASAAEWKRFVADGRPVVAHVLTSLRQQRLALARGALGTVIADIAAVLG